jgi:hypothetical protein
MRPTQRIYPVIASILLIGQFCFQLHLAKVDSQTTDEGIHLYAGYRYIKHGDFTYNPEHPPLVKYLAGIPLNFMDLNEPASYAAYAEKTKNFFFWGDNGQSMAAEDFMYNSGNDPSRVLFWARVPMALLTFMLGALLFMVGVYAWGWAGGLLALTLYVFDPMINGHGHLVTTDIGFAFGALLSLFALWRFLEQQSYQRAALCGASIGIMLLTKYSALLMGPLFLVFIVWHLFFKRRQYDVGKLKSFLGKLCVGGLTAWVVLIAGYRFQFSPPPYTPSFAQATAEANNIKDPWLPDTGFVNDAYNTMRHLMVPGDYFRGLFSFVNHATAGHSSYLFGAASLTGWWYYFPVLFSAKLLIPVLILFILSLLTLYASRKQNQPGNSIGTFFLVSFIIYFALSMTSKVNIGVRHVMLAFPLMHLMIGGLARQSPKHSKIVRYVITASIALIILEFTYISPYYLSYFNPLYGGSWNGYKTAADSNLDWGQDLYRIKEYVDAKGIDPLFLDYFWAGTSAANHYGLTYRYFADFDREKDHGYIIIPATSLVQERNKWLRDRQPYDRITPAVFVYKI